MKKIIFIAIAGLLAISATAQQLKTAQGITTITTIEKPKKEWKAVPIEKGFEQSVELGAGPAVDDDLCFLSAEYIAGYRFNDIFFVGGGTGFDWEVDEGSLAMPIFANIRAYAMPKSRWQPVFGLSAGVVFKVDGVDDDYGYNTEHSPIGIHLNPTIGVNYRINQKYSCYCTVGYMLKTVEEYHNGNRYDWIYSANCLSIKLGFTF